MTNERRHFLVVGGGPGGMAAAISLRQNGAAVDLIDSDREWRAVGAGITITGPTLRAFDRLGVLPDVVAAGFMSDRVKFFTGDGVLMHEMQTPSLEPDLPPAGGIMRPDLHRIMASHVRAHAVDVRLGITVDALEQRPDVVEVQFSDGSTRRYDGVVGADGYHSTVRGMILPEAPAPQFTGQGCWRMVAERPADLTGAEIYFGPGYKVGANPCSSKHCYVFVTTAMPGNPFIAEDALASHMRALLAPIGGTRIPDMLAAMGPHSQVNYRPLNALLLPPPWHVGAIGLIGDAIHATTPHLASGAGLAVEDGLLLGGYLAQADDVEAAWRDFEARRWERARIVVENSLQICRWELEGGHDQDVARLMAESVAQLARPM